MLAKLILLFSIFNTNSLNLPYKLSRKTLICSSFLALPSYADDSSFTENISSSQEIDLLSRWSFFGLVPPPIERKITYNELLEEIKNNKIKSIQIAVQHDCVIATNNEGHRLSLLLPDKLFENLIMDSIDKKGNQLVEVLPIDPIKQKIRNAAQLTLTFICTFYLAIDLGLLEYDLTSYSSIKERNDAYANGKKPRKVLKNIITKLLKNKSKYDEDLNKILGINNKTKI